MLARCQSPRGLDQCVDIGLLGLFSLVLTCVLETETKSLVTHTRADPAPTGPLAALVATFLKQASFCHLLLALLQLPFERLALLPLLLQLRLELCTRYAPQDTRRAVSPTPQPRNAQKAMQCSSKKRRADARATRTGDALRFRRSRARHLLLQHGHPRASSWYRRVQVRCVATAPYHAQAARSNRRVKDHVYRRPVVHSPGNPAAYG